MLAAATPAVAGGYVSPGVKWQSFAARAEADEPTPNYYSYGFGLSTGYSLRQVFDLGVYGQYAPSSRKAAKFGKGDAVLVSYGGELGLRFAESVYVGLRGGASQYKLNESIDDKDIDGKWGGPSGGLAIGAVTKLSKTSFLQTTFEVMHYVLADKDGLGRGKRRFDSFALGVAYLYIGKGDGGSAFENAIFKNFLDSIISF